MLTTIVDAFTWQKQRGLYQSKVTSSLAAIQRPGHRADSYKMVYWSVAGLTILFSLCFYLVFSWSTSDLRSQCHLTLTNTGRRELKGSASVRQAIYEARSGIVGGHIEIQELKMRGTRNYHSKHFFLFIGWEHTTWPAKNCPQIIFCSCVIVTTFLYEKWPIASLSCQGVIQIWRQTWTIVELSGRKISWFVSVSQILSVSGNNWSAHHWEVRIFCSTSTYNC